MKNVLVLGAGISGLGAAHVLFRHECNVIVSDLKDNIKDKKEKEILQSFGVVFEFGMQSVELLDGIDTVVVSPVISAENIVVMEAFKRRIPVISEIELAYRVTKAPILAVTAEKWCSQYAEFTYRFCKYFSKKQSSWWRS